MYVRMQRCLGLAFGPYFLHGFSTKISLFNTLSTDQVSMPYLFSLSRYQTKCVINPIQVTRFSSVTSANVGICSQNFLTFSFNPFGVKFQVRTQCQSQIIELEPRLPLKKSGFSVQILIKLRLWYLVSQKCQLPNFGHMTTFTL